MFQGADGDFVLIAYRREDGHLLLVTDTLGRLPIYRMSYEGRTVVSRELGRAVRQTQALAPDQLGIAEYLTFGYCLGSRTLLRSVERLPPATALRFDPQRQSILEDQYDVFDFSPDLKNDRDIGTNADELATRFQRAARRQKGACPVVSLSGGLDSRSVAAALASDRARLDAVTYLDEDGRATRDVEVAARIAEVLKLEWKTIDLAAPTERDRHTLIAMKAGLNSVLMAFILPFHRAIRAEFGSGISHLTGDGGDKVLPKLTHPRKCRNLDELAQLIFAEHALMSGSTAAEVARLPRNAVRESLLRTLSDYPEDELSAKYVHFLIYERAVRQNFEGEDRNRHYFWSASPFYSTSVFSFAFECPDRQKAGYRLYSEFLSRLSREVAEIERPAFGGAITDRRHRLLRRSQQAIARFPAVERIVNRARSKTLATVGEEHQSVKYLRAWEKRSGWPGEALDLQRIDREIEDGRLTGRQSQLLESVVRLAALVS